MVLGFGQFRELLVDDMGPNHHPEGLLLQLYYNDSHTGETLW